MTEREGKEILFEDVYKGMVLPEITYTLTIDILKKYLEAIDDLNPLYLDEEYAKKTPFGGLIVPPVAIAIFTTISNLIRPLGMKIPPGLLHAQQRYEFTGIIRPNETLKIRTVIEDKYEKRGRKFVVWKSEVFNQNGDKVATSWLTPIWPK